MVKKNSLVSENWPGESFFMDHLDTMISFANLLCILLTYLIESWISPGCSYEFSVVYVQREKSQYLFYYNMRSIHFQEQK